MARQTIFVTDYFYHIYNRGSRKADIFFEVNDYTRWEELLYWCANIDYTYSIYKNRLVQLTKEGKTPQEVLTEIEHSYRITPSLVEIVAYAHMPNHFHLVLKQTADNGISRFIHRMATAYAKYINEKYNMIGSLFQGPVKAVRIDTDEQFITVVRYVHTNPVSANLTTIKGLSTYPWTSFNEYMNRREKKFLNKTFLLNYFDRDRNRLYSFTTAPFESEDIDKLEELTIDDDYDWYTEKRRIRKDQIKDVREKLL